MNGEVKSRTEYSARNISFAMIGRVAALLMGFISRVVFTHTLEAEYVGVNGLFTDILNVLSLSELGIGTAITYALYKPIAENDTEKQKSYMKMYRTFYHIVAVLVFVIGLCITPFLDVIIRNKPDIPELTLIYLMYLANSVISYLLIYKKTLIDAHQKSYIGVVIQTSSWIVQIVIQIIILFTTHNFVFYLSIMLVSTLVSNVLISHKANLMYPYLKDKNINPLSSDERSDIFKNVKAMILHKVGDVAVNNTDNILLASVVGLTAAGRYSNYYLIIESVRGVFVQIFNGITASVGNLGVVENRDRVKKIFEGMYFMGHWMYGVAAICLYEVLDTFVGLSFGEQYIFGVDITLVLCVNFYVSGMRQATLSFRDSLGLFYYDRYKSICAAVINLVSSVVLGRMFGALGIFLGTFISTMTTSFWVEPYVLYKKRLNSSPLRYFLMYFLYSASTGVLWFASDFLCKNVTGGPIKVIVIKLIICAVVVDLGYYLLFGKTKEFRLLWGKALYLIGKKFGSKKEKIVLKPSQKWLLDALRFSLTEEGSLSEDIETEHEVMRSEEKSGVLSLLYPVSDRIERVELRNMIEFIAAKNAGSFYHLFYMTMYVSEALKKKKVYFCILKGIDLCSRYPVPEYRNFGDIDLYVKDEVNFQAARAVLEECGFSVNEKQDAPHHISFRHALGIEVELHNKMARPFDNAAVNKKISDIFTDDTWHFSEREIFGKKIPVLPDAENAFFLMVHMLHHFLNAGFGVRLLYDWVVFWKNGMNREVCERYKLLCESCEMTGFSDAVTALCVKYLGMDMDIAGKITSEGYIEKIDEHKELDMFIKEIMDSGRLGEHDRNRLVNMRTPSLSAMISEFHHQMRNSFPEESQNKLRWPVLWIKTFLRFNDNNRHVRRTNAGKIIRLARQRSKLTEKLGLWK